MTVALFWLLVMADAMAFGTWAIGWWAVPVIGLLGGGLAPRGSVPLLTVPLGAGVAWAALLVRAARVDGFGRFTDQLALLFGVPPSRLFLATLLLPVVLALGAALLGSLFQPRRRLSQ